MTIIITINRIKSILGTLIMIFIVTPLIWLELWIKNDRISYFLILRKITDQINKEIQWKERNK